MAYVNPCVLWKQNNTSRVAKDMGEVFYVDSNEIFF